MRNILLALLLMLSFPLFAQQGGTFKSTPENHEKNKALAAGAYDANLKKYKGNSNFLVLPGVVADKKNQRVEVMVESTGLQRDTSCEFLVIGETSSHGYESLLIAFAKPGDVHKAITFLGKEQGKPYDPSSLRFWARGETFTCSLVKSNEQPVILENMIVDKRTQKTLPEKGFMFIGSQTVPSTSDPNKKVYAADEYDPKSIISLFNTMLSVLEVPYRAPQGEIYENSSINSDYELPEGTILTLVIEPVGKDNSKRVKDLALIVQSVNSGTNKPVDDAARLNALQFQLKDNNTILNKKPDLKSVIETIYSLDKNKNDYFLTLNLADNIGLGDAHMLAKVFALMDFENVIRIEPPPPGQLYYKAFLPDRTLINREERIVQPWELSLAEKEGNVSGRLLLINQVWKDEKIEPDLEITELPVATPKDLRKELDAEAERSAKSQKTAKPPVILVFAPPTMKLGQLIRFLEPVMPTHKIIHVFVNDAMPEVSRKKL